jgi:hypothetical protein
MSFYQRLQAEIDEEAVKTFSHNTQNSEDSERRNLKFNPSTTAIPTVNPANEKRHPNDKSALSVTPSLRGGGGYQPQHHKAKSSKHSVPKVTRTVPIQPSRVVPSITPILRAGNRPRVEIVEPVEEQAQGQEPEDPTQGQVLTHQSDELELQPQPQLVQDFHPSFSSLPSAPRSCVSLLREALTALDTNDMSTFDKIVDEAKILQQADIEGDGYFYIFEAASKRFRSGKVEEAEKLRSMLAKHLEILDKGSYVEYYQPVGWDA